ncbi:MAG: hypothetical protein IT161_04770 [Bryobacterales bacterium]|nr:hypothetical protein [Bryobacterales bacterium]
MNRTNGFDPFRNPGINRPQTVGIQSRRAGVAPARPGATGVLQANNGQSARILEGLAKPKVLTLAPMQITIQKELQERLEQYPEFKKGSVSIVGLGAVELPELLPQYTTSGIISRCKFVDAPEPRAQGLSLWGYDLIKNDDYLTSRLVINTIRTMDVAGQIAYLRSSGVTGGDSVVLVEIHYYRNRDQTSTAFHKDTVGETLFVNLNYLNTEPIAGPEYILNPRLVPSHEQHIQGALPPQAYKDLVKVRKRLPAPTKIKWAGNIGAYGAVAFTDETIHHATPITEHRTVHSGDLKTYLEQIHPGEYRLAAQVHGYATGNQPLIVPNRNSAPISKRLFDMATFPINTSQWYSRSSLQAAGMPGAQIDELLDMYGNRGQVGIRGAKSPILDPQGNTKTLRRKISRIGLDDPAFPRQSTATRSFFRTWVRTRKRR